MCSGHGKNGALCVLQREVRPQVVTTFELPGCSDMWTVMSNTDEVGGACCCGYCLDSTPCLVGIESRASHVPDLESD